MPNRLSIPREILARFLPDHPSIAAFERMFKDVADTLPNTVEEANALAAQALAAAAQALAMLAEMAAALEQLATAPAPQEPGEADDLTPRAQLGTISSQNHDQVEITGGAMDDVEIGLETPNLAKFTAVTVSGPITSTVATGTSPLAITSTTIVDNLYVARAANADHASTADFATNAAIAGGLDSPSSFPADATDLASACALANALKVAAEAKGL